MGLGGAHGGDHKEWGTVKLLTVVHARTRRGTASSALKPSMLLPQGIRYHSTTHTREGRAPQRLALSPRVTAHA